MEQKGRTGVVFFNSWLCMRQSYRSALARRTDSGEKTKDRHAGLRAFQPSCIGRERSPPGRIDLMPPYLLPCVMSSLQMMQVRSAAFSSASVASGYLWSKYVRMLSKWIKSQVESSTFARRSIEGMPFNIQAFFRTIPWHRCIAS